MRIATDPRDDRGRQAKPGEAGRDIAGEAPDEARVRADRPQRCPELVRVEVDSHTPEDGDVHHARDLRTARTSPSQRQLRQEKLAKRVKKRDVESGSDGTRTRD